MAINIKFDLSGNPELPTMILANRNGNKLGQLKVNADSVDLVDKFNDASELSFTVNKYIDGELTPLWDKLVDFKLVWCKEWDCWFEIKVELDEETETVKTVFCTQLGQTELSQIMLYNIEINTEDDIARDDYKISILWDKENPKASILDRLLEKAPHYSIIHVDDTIKNIQRSFSFDNTSIKDAFDEIAEEIGCLFIYHSNSSEDGKIQRTISVYDLQQNCLNPECKYRGEFTDKCPKCGGTDINYNEDVFKDTLIFVTADQLASQGIQLVTDTDSVKNCFKLEGGDDLMTATIRNCNPNGTDYLWYFSDAVKEDMSQELVDGIEGYNVEYEKYYNNHISELNTDLVNQYNNLVEKYESFYNTKSSCINCKHEGYFEDVCPECGSESILSGKTLQTIPTTIKGYSSLMNAYYNTIDLALYLQSSLMPSIQMSKTTAKEQAELLMSDFPFTIATNNKEIESISKSTADSAALSMAKIIVKSTYKVEIEDSTYDEDNYTWTGNFVITNYSDNTDKYPKLDTDTKVAVIANVNNDTETFVKQKIEKALNKEDTDDYSISGLFKFKDSEDDSESLEFEKDYDEFCAELKKYALNPLKSFYDACDTCINILIDSGAGNKDEKPDLYEKLYEPYYNRSSAISEEIKIREKEIAIIEGVWDKTTDEENPELITKGLQQYIEECRNDIQDALDFEKYLGEELWLEFCAYRREDTYSNDNYISDGLNNAQLFERALEFYDVAENEIYKSAELQHSISTSLNNLLAIDKFEPLVDSFSVGNWIRVQVDDKIFKLRLLEYEIDFGSFEDISVEFSDVTKVKSGVTDVKSVIDQASSMATNYSSIQRQANKGGKAKETVEQWSTDGLNAALVQIQSNNNEEVIMTKAGILARSYDDINDEYLPEQLRITHNIMAYTDDNWQTVKQAIGKHNYGAYDEELKKIVNNKIGYGMSAEFVTAGVVSGSQIVGGDIYSINYENTDDKKEGSYLNLTNGHFSFAGGKLTYDGDHLSVDGEVTIATNGTIGCWNIDNFSIYKGSSVFGNAEGMYFGTEGLSLSDKFKVKNDGSMYATSGTIGGWLIEPNYIGLETWDENDCSNNVAISSTGVNVNISTFGGYDTCLLYFKNKFAVSTDGIMYAEDAVISGNITATDGEIGGWTISGNSISSTDNDYSIRLISADDIDGLCLQAGEKDNPTFYVTNAGSLYATDAYIEGTITATDGEIGGLDIDGTLGLNIRNDAEERWMFLYPAGKGELYTEAAKANVNLAFGIGTPSAIKFGVTPSGDLYASNATISGTLNAGSVGGISLKTEDKKTIQMGSLNAFGDSVGFYSNENNDYGGTDKTWCGIDADSISARIGIRRTTSDSTKYYDGAAYAYFTVPYSSDDGYDVKIYSSQNGNLDGIGTATWCYKGDEIATIPKIKTLVECIEKTLEYVDGSMLTKPDLKNEINELLNSLK